MSVFDIALEKRFTDSGELLITDLDGADVFLIKNTQTGTICRLQAGVLASFINSAIAQADILEALNAPNGVATLDSGGKVPAAQLPAYVDDVLEYATASAFPAAGEAGKIYVALDTNLVYRWSGSAYVEISKSLALGETSATAYRGDQGKTAYDHSQSTGNPHGTSKADVGLGNVDNTSDANKPVSTAQQTAINAKADKTLGSITYIQAGEFLNGWVNYTGTFPDAGYYKDSFGLVHLTGLIKSGTMGAEAFYLPVGFRPSKYLYLPAGGASSGIVRIAPDGAVRPTSGNNSYFGLDGVSFRLV